MSDDAQVENETSELEEAVEQATEAVDVQLGQLDELVGTQGSGEPLALGQLLDVPVELTVVVGSSRQTLGDLVKLGPGSLLELDRAAHETADILVNGKVVARGEIVTVGDSYGVRITDVKG